jgi:hypothetical protein
MPNFGALVLGPPDIRRIFPEHSFVDHSPSSNVPS